MWANLHETANLVTFTGETLNEKLHFLYNIRRRSLFDYLHKNARIWLFTDPILPDLKQCYFGKLSSLFLARQSFVVKDEKIIKHDMLTF